MSNKFLVMVESFERAVGRLEEGLEKGSRSDLERDGVIQRFEYTFELAWKTLKTFMEETGGASPLFARDCFKEAFRRGLVHDEDKWLEMIRLRNLTRHTYWEASAEDVMTHLPHLVGLYRTLVERLKKETRK
jgi:nucleotidyltransferase substrate binding protein (TIGR01987 family)